MRQSTLISISPAAISEIEHVLVCPLFKLKTPALAQTLHSRHLPQLSDVRLGRIQYRCNLEDEPIFFGVRPSCLELQPAVLPVVCGTTVAREAKATAAGSPVAPPAEWEAETPGLPSGANEDATPAGSRDIDTARETICQLRFSS